MFYAVSSASSVVTPLRDLMYLTDHLHQVNFTIEINFPDYFLIESTTLNHQDEQYWHQLF